MTKNLYLGVMSGTSVDAIDIVAVKIFDGSFEFELQALPNPT